MHSKESGKEEEGEGGQQYVGCMKGSPSGGNSGCQMVGQSSAAAANDDPTNASLDMSKDKCQSTS